MDFDRRGGVPGRSNAGASERVGTPGKQTLVEASEESHGNPLPDRLRGKFESSLGADLSNVRVHTGAQSAAAADANGAKAFAVGQNIHFGAGNYDPGSREGEELLAHEVAHTVQQRGAVPRLQLKDLSVSSPGDHHEQEADVAASRMVAAQSATVTPAPTMIARKEKQPEKPGTDAALITSLRKTIGATKQRLATANQKLGLLPKQGLKTARDAKSEMTLARDSYKTAYASFCAVLANQGEKAAAANFYTDFVKDKLVSKIVGVMLGPLDGLVEGVAGKVLQFAADKVVPKLVQAGVDAVLPDEEVPAPPPPSTANDTYTEALEKLEAVEESMIDASRWNQTVFALNNAVRDLELLVVDAGPDTKPPSAFTAPVAALSELNAACASCEADVARALGQVGEVKHQASLVRQNETDVERRLWSEWLLVHKPGDLIKKRLQELGLADANGNATVDQDLQKYIGSECVVTSVDPASQSGACKVRLATDLTGAELPAAGAGGDLQPGAKVIITNVYCGALQVASPHAKPAPDLVCPPGTVVTVVTHLMPVGSVMTSSGISKAIAEPKGIAVASGSKVPVLRNDGDTVVVDASKATGGTPYGQYGTPGVSDDSYFPIDAKIPGKDPINFGYHVETVTGLTSKKYYVKDGFHLEPDFEQVKLVKG
jgi:hypothetical protein